MALLAFDRDALGELIPAILTMPPRAAWLLA